MQIKIILILTLVISSCSGTRNLSELSELTIDNRLSNELIVDRIPEYGIDGRDGCVVMGEISMNITQLDRRLIRGKVFDSQTKEPLINAKLTLTINKNGVVDKKNIVTNDNGIYNSVFNGVLKKIEVEYIAYRNLEIDIRR